MGAQDGIAVLSLPPFEVRFDCFCFVFYQVAAVSSTTGKGKEAKLYFNTTGEFLFIKSTSTNALGAHSGANPPIGVEYSHSLPTAFHI